MTSNPLIEHLENEAEALDVGGHQPFSLMAGQGVWWVAEGAVEVFAVRDDPDVERGPRRLHIRTVPAGSMLFSLERRRRRLPFGPRQGGDGLRSQLMAVGTRETRLLRLDLPKLKELARRESLVPHLARQLEDWVVGLYHQLPRAQAPRDFVLLEGGQENELESGHAARTRSGVLWVRHVEGDSRFLGRDELGLEAASPPIPLSDETWLVSGGDTRLSSVETPLLIRSGGVWEALAAFHRLFLDDVEHRIERTEAEERRQLDRRHRIDHRTLEHAFRDLASVLGDGDSSVAVGEGATDPLLTACRWVGEAQGITLRSPPSATAGATPERARASGPAQQLARICAASRVRTREVLLRGTWWRRDNGPLLAFLAEGEAEAPTHHPVALLPTVARRYVMVDPRDGSRREIDDDLAGRFHGMAVMLYPPLPERPLKARDLVSLAIRGQGRDATMMLLMGLGGGLLATLAPIVTGYLFGHAIPNADRPQVFQMTLALVVAALAGGIFQLVRGIAVLRIGGRMDGIVQAAVWDRLMALPVDFFRRYRVGDLASRSLGVDAIRALVTGSFATSLLSAVFSIFSFALLFLYSPPLALLATAFVLVLMAVTLGLSMLQVRYQRRQLEIEGQVSSLLFGLISGIAKLRIVGAERRAFARWAQRFAEQRRQALRARTAANVQMTFSAVYHLLSLLGLFAMMGSSAELGLSVSDFLAFNAAYGQFQAASLTILGLLPSVLTIVPLYERLKPILETAPEVDPTKAEVPELSGDVELAHLTFRYQSDGPLILDDVSFRARPGEFVALVGPSGSGKSTCLRLILGFERPAAGSIYFDGQDLQSLDIQGVRRQIGVVLQNSRPSSGTLFSNIVGSTNLGLEAAWEAARMAGLADDIEAMPMGMHTVISEGASTFSGGQIQRLMIARAIVHKPRIVLFDEATSALDNRAQEIVSRSLEGLKATRIAVAHRLSTVRRADRIIVIDEGRVVESGTFEELMAASGTFARLARRQMA